MERKWVPCLSVPLSEYRWIPLHWHHPPTSSSTFNEQHGHLTRVPLLHSGHLAVLSFLVPIEDGPLVEAPPTGRAVVGLLPSVDPLVSDQPLPFAEPFSTHLAPIRLLASVGAPVHCQVGISAEALAALAGIGLLPSVSSPMHLQMLSPAEAFPAVSTLIGLLPCVAPLVDLEVVPLTEGFPALATHIGPLSQVGSLVLHEVLSQSEPLPTLNTAIGFLFFMGSLVSDKIGAPTEAFSTLRALKRLPEGAVGLEVTGQGNDATQGRRWPWHASPRAAGLLLTGSFKLRALESSFLKPL